MVRVQNMTVFAEYPAKHILPMLGLVGERGFVDTKERREFEANGTVYCARVNSLRLQCFANNHACVKCGVVGELFRLEQSKGSGKNPRPAAPHLNMYAQKDGELILMTKDHILPKSRGGKDHLCNLQTMCCVCNEAKGNSLQLIESSL